MYPFVIHRYIVYDPFVILFSATVALSHTLISHQYLFLVKNQDPLCTIWCIYIITQFSSLSLFLQSLCRL